MRKTQSRRIDASLIDVFGRVGREFAEKIKREYNLKELFISDVLASQLIAGKMNGVKSFRFRIEKTGAYKGVLKLE